MNAGFRPGSTAIWHCLVNITNSSRIGHDTMTKTVLTALTAAIAFAAITADANAAARTYFKPNVDGDRVSACLSTGNSCGRPVADRLCIARGFERALSYKLDPVENTTRGLRTVDNELVSGEGQKAFAFVKCYKPNEKPSTVTFNQPAGEAGAAAFRLAAANCSEGNDHCTRDAADAWCKQRGFGLGARTYAVKLDLGLSSDTLIGAASADEVDLVSSFSSISCQAR